MTPDTPLAIALIFFVIPGLFMTAGFFDVLTTRIPDWISLLIVALFALGAVSGGMPMMSILWHTGAGLFVFFLGFVAFSLGWMGGGDGKLAAAGALWFGPVLAPQFLMFAFLYGGAMVIAMVLLRRMPLPHALLRQKWLAQWLGGQEGLPFGLAMAAAVLTLTQIEMQTFVF